LFFEVLRVVADVDPAAVRDTLRVELEDDLREVEVFCDPLCKVRVRDAWDFDVRCLAFAVIARFRASDLGIDVRMAEARVDFDPSLKMLPNRLKNFFT